MSGEVELGSIERELAAMWRMQGEGVPSERGPAVVRSCVMNLVVCCSGTTQVEHLANVAAQVTTTIPARVVVAIEESSGDQEAIRAALSTRCALARGADAHRQICCEQIVLRAGGAMARRLPGAIVPLLLPDLPVVLWWPDQPCLTGDPGLRLVQHADWLVVDSGRFTQQAAQLEWLASLDRPIADIAWQRLRGWRELTARLFDARGFEDYPERISRIQVVCEGGDGCPVEGMLLGSWIASRLGWHPGAASGDLTWHLVRPGGEAGDLHLTRQVATGRPGRVVSLVLTAGDATFQLSRPGPDMLTGSVLMNATCPLPRTARVVDRDEATLLARALQAGARDRIYDAALALAARLLGPDFMESVS